MKARVPKHQNPREFVSVETDATIGATIGTDVRNADGTLFDPVATAAAVVEAAEATKPSVAVTIWRYILEIPANIVALAATATTGLYVITGAGTSATRTIQPTTGRTTVSNGNGVAGDPVIDLAARPDTGVGAALVRTTFDAYGRREGTQAASTTDLSEGTNLYYTDVRADARVNAGINAHVASADPHTQYLTGAEADAAYTPLSHVGAGGPAHANAVAAGAAGFMTGADKTKLDGITGTNTGDQTITLTGDVTGSGTGSFAATIAANAVTNAKLADVPTATLKGRITAAAGDPEDLTAAQARTVLNVADGATANATDAQLRDRATHTGTQLASTVSDFAAAADARIAAANIDAFADVTITTPAAGQPIVRNAANTGWENGAASSGGANLPAVMARISLGF